MAKQTGKFFLAGVLGAIAGAIGGLLLAPQSGKKTRQEIANLALEISRQIKNKADYTKDQIKDVFGKYTEEGKQKYEEIRSTVINKVASIKTAGEEVDKEKYFKVVESVIEEFKDDLAATKNGGAKIGSYLKNDWDKIKKALS